MSLFLLVPEKSRALVALLPLLGAENRLAAGPVPECIRALGDAADSTITLWSLYEVAKPDADRLVMVSEAITEQLQQEGQAVLDLEAKMVTMAELQEIATGLMLEVGFVAVLKRREGSIQPALTEPLDLELVKAIRDLGGSASTGQIASRLGFKRRQILGRLKVLAAFGRIIITGKKGGTRYSLPTEGS